MSMESLNEMTLTGKNQRTRRKACANATVSTQIPHGLTQVRTPGLHGERPAINCLSHVMATREDYMYSQLQNWN
jgi:hypothetical protein